MQKNEIGFYDGVNYYSSPLLVVFFFSPSWLAPFLLGFLHPFIFHPQQIFKQKELNLTHQGSNP